MPNICYEPRRFGKKAQVMLLRANEIIDEYQKQGFELTLRQLYYQFVARGFIPNTPKEYNNLGVLINAGRLAGEIDWNAIIDRTRNLESNPHWNSPADILRSAAYSYQRDKWADQENAVEVWIEKEALIGIIERTCRKYDVAYFACRGYVSQSEMWAASQRFLNYDEQVKTITIIHLGDHDPSGIDMTRDIFDRIRDFCRYHKPNMEVNVIRIALNMDQVRKYNPPPNPAKLKDKRANKYIRRFGSECWELDALEPSVIEALVAKNIQELMDDKKWEALQAKESKERQKIEKFADQI